MRRAIRTVLAIALVACLGCRRGPAPRGDGQRTVRDGLGRAVRMPPSVRRVVSLAPSTTEILYALGVGDRVVGVDRHSDYPPAVSRVEKVGDDLAPSLERIFALRPDIVFTATTANAQETVDALERAGLSTYVSSPHRLADILDDVGRIADALDEHAAGERLGRALSERIGAVQERVRATRPTSALTVVWADPLVVAARETHVDDLLRVAGGANIATDAVGYPNYSVERVIAGAPEVIIYATREHALLGRAMVPPSLARLGTVPAVRSGRVHAVDGDLLFRPGPRVVEGVEALATLLHPTAPPGNGGSP